MIKVYLNVYGMKCGMCEAHINDTIRKNYKAKKVKSNHKKNETTFIIEDEHFINMIIEAIKSLGYSCNLNKTENI